MGNECKMSDEHRKSCRRENDRRSEERRQHDEPIDRDLRSSESRRVGARRSGRDRRD